MGYSGAGEKLIHEKKISWHCPFNLPKSPAIVKNFRRALLMRLFDEKVKKLIFEYLSFILHATDPLKNQSHKASDLPSVKFPKKIMGVPRRLFIPALQ